MAPDRVKEIIRDELKGGWAVEDGDVWTSVTNINFVVKELDKYDPGFNTPEGMVGRVDYPKNNIVHNGDTITLYVQPKFAPYYVHHEQAEKLLLQMINEYRASLGIHPYLSPYTYYDRDNPGLGDRIRNKARNIAKEQVKLRDCAHEGGQIGAYFGGGGDGAPSPMTEQEIAEHLFWQWRNSSGHNWTLTLSDGDEWVAVGLCEIWEYVEFDYRGITGIFGHSSVLIEQLPSGVTLPY